jgi:nitroreductase
MKELLKLIQERQSIRMPFDPEHRVAKKDLEQILEAGRWTPTPHNMQNFEIIVVDDEKVLKSIGNIKHPVSETFIRENYKQLSFSDEELIKRKTGLLARMFPTSWTTLDHDLNIKTKDTDLPEERPFPSCPLMLFVIYDSGKRAPASEGDFLGILSLGCLMENMWLMANSLGISFHIMSSLSSEDVEDEVKNILHVPGNLKIAFSCRLGYPAFNPGNYLRVRRDIKDFTHHNKFGIKGLE